MSSASPSLPASGASAEKHPQRGLAAVRLLAIIGLFACTVFGCTTQEETATSQPVVVKDSQPPKGQPEPGDHPKHEESKHKRIMDSKITEAPVPQEIMQKLVEAVAAEAGVTTKEVKLERAEKRTYGDGSLDCPQPNMGYNQVIIEGYWVVFHVGQEEYDFRVTERGAFSRCKGSTKRAPIRYDDT